MRAQRKLRDSRDKQTQLFYRNRDMLCKASCQLRAALFFIFFSLLTMEGLGYTYICEVVSKNNIVLFEGEV